MNNQLVDPFGRRITYLRLSVTDRCDFRCTYCMSEDMVFAPREQILTLEELYAVADAFIGLGSNASASPVVSRWCARTCSAC